MDFDLSNWHPGLILALIAVVGAFSTAILITTFSVGLVQWRKIRSVKEMREFVETLIAQGYTTDEIERLSDAAFRRRPGQEAIAPTLKMHAR